MLELIIAIFGALAAIALEFLLASGIWYLLRAPLLSMTSWMPWCLFFIITMISFIVKSVPMSWVVCLLALILFLVRTVFLEAFIITPALSQPPNQRRLFWRDVFQAYVRILCCLVFAILAAWFIRVITHRWPHILKLLNPNELWSQEVGTNFASLLFIGVYLWSLRTRCVPRLQGNILVPVCSPTALYVAFSLTLLLFTTYSPTIFLTSFNIYRTIMLFLEIWLQHF